MRIFLGIILLSSLCSVLRAQRLLDLDSCRTLAIKNNKTIQISKTKIQKAHYDRKAAFTKYLPDFSATGAYMHFNKEISILNESQQNKLNNLGTSFGAQLNTNLPAFLQQLAQADPALAQFLGQMVQSGQLNGISDALNKLGQEVTNAFRTDTRNMWTGAVMMTQPIYMGGKIRAYNNITRYTEKLAASQHETQIQEVILQTDEAYWMAVSLSNKQKLAENFLKLLQQLDADVERMIAAGVATKADGLSVKVKVNEAEMTLTKVNNGVSLSKMLLCQLCGLDLNTQLVLTDESIDNLPLAQTETEQAVELALKNRPELESLELATQIYNSKVNVVRADMLPTMALTGGYLVSNPSVFNGFEKKFKGMWNVGVMLQVPIFHWNEGTYKVKSAKAEAIIARLEWLEAQEKIELQVNQSTYKAEEAQKRLSMTLKSMQKAEENLRYANNGFKEGVIPMTNVMEAQTAWLSAQSDKIDAQIDIKLAQTYLQKATGQLAVQP